MGSLSHSDGSLDSDGQLLIEPYTNSRVLESVSNARTIFNIFQVVHVPLNPWQVSVWVNSRHSKATPRRLNNLKILKHRPLQSTMQNRIAVFNCC